MMIDHLSAALTLLHQVRAARYATDPEYAALHDQLELGRIDFDRNFVGLSDIRIGRSVRMSSTVIDPNRRRSAR